MAQNGNNRLKIETQLNRDFGLVTSMSIGVGTMIAAGIFTLSGLAVRNVGSSAIFSFLLAAFVAVFIALTYSEFASIHPESGGGYLYSRKSFPAPLAYLAGLTLVLGYSSSCAFYISSISSYFHEFVWHSPIEGLSGIAALIFLILVNIKGTKESANIQVAVTIAKVILLIWFIAGGLKVVDTSSFINKFSTDMVNIGSTGALVFITFFGFSAIAASGGEIKNPTKTIPRAIFWSIGIVTFLYILIILVISSADLTEYTEAAMGIAAVKFLGPIGGMVIVSGAIFSMISASNASIMAGSRVSMSMSRLGHLPRIFGIVNSNTYTPIVSLAFVGILIFTFTLSFNLENLAHFSNTVLLTSAILVNAALIRHRKKYPDIERPFKVPFVPLLPILGILTNLFLLGQTLFHHRTPFLIAIAFLVFGIIALLVWKSLQAEEDAIPGESSKVALVQGVKSKTRFRVLVPVANPANVKQLIEFAASIARDRDGEIITMRAAIKPDLISLARENQFFERERHILALADAVAKSLNVPATSLISIGHGRARTILETARQRQCDLVILGWKGYTSTARKILGDVADSIVNHAKADIILLKQVENIKLKKILLPTAGGEHARCAESYAASLVRLYGGSLTLCSVVSPDAGSDVLKMAEENLDKAVERGLKQHNLEVNRKLIVHSSVNVGIIKEAKNYDSVVVGAAGKSIYPKILFGSIPENIAKHCDKPVILVKHYHPVKALFGRVMEE